MLKPSIFDFGFEAFGVMKVNFGAGACGRWVLLLGSALKIRRSSSRSCREFLHARAHVRYRAAPLGSLSEKACKSKNGRARSFRRCCWEGVAQPTHTSHGVARYVVGSVPVSAPYPRRLRACTAPAARLRRNNFRNIADSCSSASRRAGRRGTVSRKGSTHPMAPRDSLLEAPRCLLQPCTS